MDKYSSFIELKKSEENTAYKIRHNRGDSSKYLIMAPHGGGIEPGTSELAERIAGQKFMFYSFDGTKKRGNKILHIASERYDEEQAVRMVQDSDIVIAIHGAKGNDKKIYLGGLDKDLKNKLASAIKESGFPVEETNIPRGLHGKSHKNICNRGKTKKGVQIEITYGLRKSMFKAMNKKGREQTTKEFDNFVQIIQEVLDDK